MYLTGPEKNELLEQYGYACALCGAKENLEWDHITSLSTSFGEQEFWCICAQCHSQKTSEEPRVFDGDPLVSHFCPAVWEAYVQSERTPPLIHKAEAFGNLEGCWISDVRRCRRNALLHCAHEIPVFSCLDDVQLMRDMVLGDLNFVTKAATDPIAQLGYTGSGWQHRVQTEWLLHSGVIDWKDISHKLTATGRLPADLLKKPLEKMERSWEVGGLGKQSVNAMVGTWMLDDQFAFKHISSEHPDDAPPGALKHTFFFGGALMGSKST